MKRSWIVPLILIVALLLVAIPVSAASPPEPPGLEKAIAAQEKHNPELMKTPGVVGTAVGLAEDGSAVVLIFTDKPGVRGVPSVLEGVSVRNKVSGKLSAIKAPPPSRNPVVTITSPTNDASYSSGTPIHFAATARDSSGRNLAAKIVWKAGDTVIGTGGSFDKNLSVGDYFITASATDRSGRTGSDNVSIHVVAGSEPPNPYLYASPVPIGVSTGNYQSVSAGTIACRLFGTGGTIYALSNTHVYAPNDISGQSELHDRVTHPGLYDIPSHTYSDQYDLGELVAYSPIDGYGINTVDAAIAVTSTEKLGKSTPTGGYGVPSRSIVDPKVGQQVQKYGRTTQLTFGKITGINATVFVEYAPNWYAIFAGQIIVETSTAFILPGDSGSLMVTNDENSSPVGLLFAGNDTGTYAIANRMADVMLAFGMNLGIDGK